MTWTNLSGEYVSVAIHGCSLRLQWWVGDVYFSNLSQLFSRNKNIYSKFKDQREAIIHHQPRSCKQYTECSQLNIHILIIESYVIINLKLLSIMQKYGRELRPEGVHCKIMRNRNKIK
jgi:hypothetical protein